MPLCSATQRWPAGRSWKGSDPPREPRMPEGTTAARAMARLTYQAATEASNRTLPRRGGRLLLAREDDADDALALRVRLVEDAGADALPLEEIADRELELVDEEIHVGPYD